MTDGQRCVITVHEFARMLGLEHRLTMALKARIHSFNVPKLEEMHFMYAPGVVANPPKIQNFLPELNTPLPPPCHLDSVQGRWSNLPSV
jgi:hypothetical protein